MVDSMTDMNETMIRETALRLAIEATPGRTKETETLMKRAREFERFLKASNDVGLAGVIEADLHEQAFERIWEAAGMSEAEDLDAVVLRIERATNGWQQETAARVRLENTIEKIADAVQGEDDEDDFDAADDADCSALVLDIRKVARQAGQANRFIRWYENVAKSVGIDTAVWPESTVTARIDKLKADANLLKEVTFVIDDSSHTLAEPGICEAYDRREVLKRANAAYEGRKNYERIRDRLGRLLGFEGTPPHPQDIEDNVAALKRRMEHMPDPTHFIFYFRDEKDGSRKVVYPATRHGDPDTSLGSVHEAIRIVACREVPGDPTRVENLYVVKDRDGMYGL